MNRRIHCFLFMLALLLISFPVAYGANESELDTNSDKIPDCIDDDADNLKNVQLS